MRSDLLDLERNCFEGRELGYKLRSVKNNRACKNLEEPLK